MANKGEVFFSIIIMLVGLLCSCQADEVDFVPRNHPHELNILIVGNSYSRDAFSYAPMIIEGMCPDVKVNMQILYIGGVALSKHKEYIENKKALFTLDRYNTTLGKWNTKGNIMADSVVSSQNWDCVILQEGGISARDYETVVGNVSTIIDYLRSYQSDICISFMLNPTHPIGSEALGDYTSEEEFKINAGVASRLLSAKVVDYIIPCGTAIQNARHTYLDNLGDYGHLSYEGRHLQEGIPCWTEALTAAQMFVRIFDLEGNGDINQLKITQQWVKEKNIPGRHGKVLEGRDSDYRLAQICAMKAIDSPFSFDHITVAEIFPNIFRPSLFILEAHRGLSHEYPENTILAFEKAGQTDAYVGIETDVRQTSDGVLVCMHDATIDRTTNGTGNVNSLTFDQLQQYTIDGGNGWNEVYRGSLNVPTFLDFLTICRAYDKIPYVELKLHNQEGVNAVVSMLHENGFADGSYVLASSSLDVLKYASTICDAPLEYMNNSLTDESNLAQYAKLRNIVMRPPANKLTLEFMERCKSNGLISECYGIGVGNIEQLSKLKSLDVFGGTCNFWDFSSKTNVAPLYSTRSKVRAYN